MPTVKRHKHRRAPKSITLQRSVVTKKGTSNRRVIAGIIALHPAPAHYREYTLHATKGYRSARSNSAQAETED